MCYYFVAYERWSGWARLLEPPFRVVKLVKNASALIQFGEDAFAVLRELFSRPLYFWDEHGAWYKLSDEIFEQLEHKKYRNWRVKACRGMKRFVREEAYKRRVREHDTVACARLTAPTMRKSGTQWFWFTRFRHYQYGKPGGENLYRFLFRRARGKQPAPLFIYLHGMGSWGTRGVKTMWEFTLVSLGLRRGHERCHILLPQLPYISGKHGEYDSDAYSATLGEVIDWIAETTGTLDRARVYLVGSSMGGQAVISECRRHPDRYAAAVPVVGVVLFLLPGETEEKHEKDCYHPLPLEAIVPALTKTPLWLAYSYNERDWYEPLYQALKDAGAQVRDTRVDTLGHGMSALFYPFQPWAKWLFSHTKK